MDINNYWQTEIEPLISSQRCGAAREKIMSDFLDEEILTDSEHSLLISKLYNAVGSDAYFDASGDNTVIEPIEFAGTRINTIIIPESVKYIDDFAFSYSGIKRIIFKGPGTDITFGYSIFHKCDAADKDSIYVNGSTTTLSSVLSDDEWDRLIRY